VAVCLLPVGAASADTLSTGINLERFVPGVGPGALLGIDGAAAPARRFSLVASLDEAHGLLAIRNRLTGDFVSNPLRSLLAVDVAGEVSIGRRVSVGVGVPLALGMTGDRLAGLGLGDERSLAAGVLGDLRLRVRVHLLSRRGLDLAVALLGTVPLGGQSEFFATSGPTLEARGLSGWATGRGWLRLGAEVGLRLSPERHLYDALYAHELHLALGLDLHVPRPAFDRLHLLAEVHDTYVVASGGASWLEARAGLRLQALPWLSVDVGVGSGLSAAGPGAPHPRLFTVVRVDR